MLTHFQKKILVLYGVFILKLTSKPNFRVACDCVVEWLRVTRYSAAQR